MKPGTHLKPVPTGVHGEDGPQRSTPRDEGLRMAEAACVCVCVRVALRDRDYVPAITGGRMVC